MLGVVPLLVPPPAELPLFAPPAELSPPVVALLMEEPLPTLEDAALLPCPGCACTDEGPGAGAAPDALVAVE